MTAYGCYGNAFTAVTTRLNNVLPCRGRDKSRLSGVIRTPASRPRRLFFVIRVSSARARGVVWVEEDVRTAAARQRSV